MPERMKFVKKIQFADELAPDRFGNTSDQIPKVGDSVRFADKGDLANVEVPEYIECELQGCRIVVRNGIIVEVKNADEAGD